MCGVIVVDAESFWSTNHGCDADIHDHCLGYRHDYLKFYQLPNSNLFTHHLLFFSREATSETYDPPDLFFIIFAFAIYFPLLLFLDRLNQKYKNTLLHFILFGVRSIKLLQLSHVRLPISGASTPKGLTTPLIRRVASICYLCAGAVYVVLLGSPTGSVTLVSSLREIPTAVVLHHPFLFGEIPT